MADKDINNADEPDDVIGFLRGRGAKENALRILMIIEDVVTSGYGDVTIEVRNHQVRTVKKTLSIKL